MDFDKLIDEITEAVMFERGYDRDNPSDKLEWDPTNDDSQYSLAREDVELIVDLLDEKGMIYHASEE